MSINLNEIRNRLKRYRIILAEKNELVFKLDEINQLIGVKAVTYDSAGSNTNKISNTVANQALSLIETKEELEILINTKGLELDRIKNAISVLSLKEKEIIELKHIEDYSWETVAYNVDRSTKTCKKIEREALIKINNILAYNI